MKLDRVEVKDYESFEQMMCEWWIRILMWEASHSQSRNGQYHLKLLKLQKITLHEETVGTYCTVHESFTVRKVDSAAM